MYQQPTKEDLDRNLSAIFHEARQKAHADQIRIASECASRGMGSSTSRIGLVVQAVNGIHENALGQSMNLLRTFVERGVAPPDTIASWARPHLQNLANTLLAEIPAAGFAQEQQRVRHQYSAVFSQRLDGALRDIQIGFIGGLSIMTDQQTSQSRALRLLKQIYDRTRESDQPVFVAELAGAAGLTEAEAQAAWRYLKDKHFIDTYSIQYTARVNAAGIHAIEDAQRDPDHPTGGFPSITYNIVNVGSAVNSPIQQAGAHATVSQSVTYNAQEHADLSRLVAEFTSHLDELGLDARSAQRAKAQVATIEAQLTDEPDPTIVRQAGRTLRNITEGAIGSLVAAAAQPTIWHWVSSVLPALFP